MDKQLSSYLHKFNIPIRKKASNGLWLQFVLPITLLGGALKYKSSCSFLYWHFALLSMSFLINSVCGVLHYVNKCQLPLKQIGTLASMTTSSLLLTLYSFQGYGVYVNIFHSVVCSLCYHTLLEHLMRSVKYGFTYGEASIVTQSIILFQMHSYTKIFFHVQEAPVLCEDIATIVIQIGLTCIIALGSLVHLMKPLRHYLSFYSCLVVLALFGAGIPLHIILRRSPVLWMIQVLLVDFQTMLLLVYWVGCVLIAIAVMAGQISSKQKATTSLRKYFHILAVVVFIPGILVNPCLMYLASGLVLALFLLLEIMRLLHLPPLAQVLNKGFLAYVDEKDSHVAITPIYLLTGCSLPLWLSPLPLDKTDLLVLSAGVLSIGIGDTFASMLGSKIGKHKWSNSKKSIEGSIACFLSQLVIILVYIYLEFIPWNRIFIGVMGTAVVTIIEAKTDQVDNLILPLVQFCIFLLG